MRNKGESKIRTIFSKAEKLPFFSLDNLTSLEKDKNYLRTLFSRYKKSGKTIRLKKGIYVAKSYVDGIEKAGSVVDYVEFLTGTICPSYLSLDYVLHKHNVITEMPVNFTAITKKKTTSFVNELGKFVYHSVKPSLFCGYKIIKKGEFSIFEATKAKALFDFLYLRKDYIASDEAAKELRLNLGEFDDKDRKELMGYIELEGSKAMKRIYTYLFK